MLNQVDIIPKIGKLKSDKTSRRFDVPSGLSLANLRDVHNQFT
jgi:hypothetical protein